MTAFDTDVFSDLLFGRPSVAARADEVGLYNIAVPVGTVEEVLEGWMAAINRSRERVGRNDVTTAYGELQRTITATADFVVLPYTPAAQAKFLEWRADDIRIGTRDFRTAATCVAHGVELVTRNRRDFDQVPGLNLTVWN